MKIEIICIVGLIMFFSCTTKTSNVNVKSDSNRSIKTIDSQTIDRKILTDSIKILKNIGIEILNGAEIPKIKEENLQKLIQSILVKDSVERAFYFKVFNKIREKAYGYVSEDISFYAKEFCYSYPNDFFCMADNKLKTYAKDIGEIIRTEEEDPGSYLKNYISEIKRKSNVKYFNKIEIFGKEMSKIIE